MTPWQEAPGPFSLTYDQDLVVAPNDGAGDQLGGSGAHLSSLVIGVWFGHGEVLPSFPRHSNEPPPERDYGLFALVLSGVRYQGSVPGGLAVAREPSS
jgi:hypothetical protein